MDKAIGWGLALLALVIVTATCSTRDTQADGSIEAAVAPPVAWIGTPEIVGTRIEVDAPVVVPNETSYMQTITYRQVTTWQVHVGITAE